MNRYVSDRSQRPDLKRPEHIEVAESNLTGRLIALILFALIGAGALTYFITGLVRTNTGWQEISVNSSVGDNCGGSFTLLYNLGTTDVSPRVEKQAAATVYSQSCETAYKLFNSDVSSEDVVNLRTLDALPNTVVTVDPAFYQVLEMIQSSGSRILYYRPLYETLESLCTAAADSQAAECDPELNEDIALFFDEVLSFANDPESLNLQLLGDNQVKFYVSDAAQSYAEENQLDGWLTFGPLDQPLCADYVAAALIASGYINGILTGKDGSTRCLNQTDVSFTVFDREGNEVRSAATATVSGMSSFVTLRDFSLDSSENEKYYVYSDGRLVTPWLNENGDNICVLPSITACSAQCGCVEVLLKLIEASATGEIMTEKLAGTGIYSVYCSGRQIVSNIPGVQFTDFYNKNGVRYSA